MAVSEPPQGAQLISRAADILRAIPRGTPGGRRLRDIAQSTGLTEPTVRRILMALIHEGFVVQDPSEKRYRLGPLAFELGLASGFHSELVTFAQPHLMALAADTGMTAVLGARARNESVSISMADGDVDISDIMTPVGERLPLGVGVGGVALLAEMRDAEIDEVLTSVNLEAGSINEAEIRRRVAAARAAGYADISDLPLAGLRGIAATVPGRKSTPGLYLALVSSTERMARSQTDRIVDILQMTAKRLGAALDLK